MRILFSLLALSLITPCGIEAQSRTAASALGVVLVGSDPATAVISNEQLQILTRQLAIDINSLPTQTSSGLEYGSAEGRNLGPVFLERATLIGRRALDVVLVVQHGTWTRLDGIQLGSNELVNKVPSVLGRPAVESKASIELSSQTATIAVNYGVSSTVDVGIAVPFQRVCVSGVRSVTLTPGGTRDTSAEACSTGVGDLLAKVKFARRARGVYLGAELAFSAATGDADRLLGKGDNQPSIMGIVSRHRGVVQPQLNVGATLGGHGVEFSSVDIFGVPAFVVDRISSPRSFNYGLGTNFFLRGATASIEVLGRRIRHAAVFQGFDALSGASLESRPVPWQNRVVGAAAVKTTLPKDLVLSGHVMRQFTKSGLRSSWVLGMSVTRPLRAVQSDLPPIPVVAQ